MADILWTQGRGIAEDKFNETIKFNKERSQGQYKYIYIVKLSDGYMVRLSQIKPTSKNIIKIIKTK